MNPIGLLLLRQIWWHHREGLLASLGIFVGAALLYPSAQPGLARLAEGLGNPVVALGLGVILAMGALIHLMSIFLMADEKLGDMTSGYPSRMFSLPVRTGSLVLYPMVLGATAMALAWTAMAVFLFRRAGFSVPIGMPILGLMVLLAWLQALSWTPFWLHSAAIVISCLALGGQIGAAVWLRSAWNLPPWAFVLAGGLSIASAYRVALTGVARDRRGEGREPPGWWKALTAAIGDRRAAVRRPLRTAAEAQLWFEWKKDGLSLPSLVALPVVMMVGFSFWLRLDFQRFVMLTAATLAFPALFASALGSNLARTSPIWMARSRCDALWLTRPLSSGGLAAAKFQAAAWSVLVSYAVVLVGFLIMAVVPDYRAHFVMMGHQLVTFAPGIRAVGLVVLVVLLALILAFRQATSGLTAGLTGRAWLMDFGVLAFAATVIGVTVLELWAAFDERAASRLRAAGPWIVVSIAALKAVVSVWGFHRAVRRGVMRSGEAAGIVGVWGLISALILGLIVWLTPAGLLPAPATSSAMVIVFLLVPLARFALAPLAVDWNRHR